MGVKHGKIVTWHEASVAILQASPVIPAQPAATTPCQPQCLSKSTRCQHCHAMGHTVTDCHTQDPITMKKCVASMQKAAKMEHTCMAAILPHRQQATTNLAFPIQDFFGDPIIPSSACTMTTQSMAALAVNATELRRQKIQSTQDKRQRNASSTNTATNNPWPCFHSRRCVGISKVLSSSGQISI